jgi:uncharacterized protein YyaL (SSP411 family)
MDTKHGQANHLMNETSPYLLAHAHNPVDWYPWGEVALEKAKKENKPIFLSIGYNACHWCHVMEKESFEDPQVGRLLNEYFVAIKVDREERPDIDDIYMTAVQAMTGSGGWPMSVFLTPDGEPFYTGTYFPREDHMGRPGFIRILTTLGNLWRQDEAKVRAQGSEVTRVVQQQLEQELPVSELPPDLLKRSVAQLEQSLDNKDGGFGSAPKFPASMAIDLYTDLIHRGGDGLDMSELKAHLRLCLRKMAQGGMYDQIGGGFCRYSTDDEWYVPHFEKMLYDNALLACTYFEASQVVDKDFNLRIGCEILDYVLRDMTHPQGAFYATTDADSEGLEGKFFLWSVDQVKTVLGEDDGALFCDIYDIRAESWQEVSFAGGTPPHAWFAGRIARLVQDLEVHLRGHKLTLQQIDAWRQTLWQAREQRVHPSRDEKVLVSWNGLMSTAFAIGYRLTGQQKYVDAARRNLDFIWDKTHHQGRLNATWKDGRARHFATLEDHANFAAACLTMHQIGGGTQYLERARMLTDSVIAHFQGGPGRAFYYTADDAEKLIVRSKNPYDNAVPGANSTSAGNLTRLGRLLGRADYMSWAEGIFKEFSVYMDRAPRGFSRLIREYGVFAAPSREWILVGGDQDLRQAVLRHLRPGDFFLTEADATLALLDGKLQHDGPTLYVCLDGACQLPVQGLQAIFDRLMNGAAE